MTTITHEFVDGDGVRLHCARAGNGRLMLFLHGFPEFWYAWRHQLPCFGELGWCAVAPDMRGYNLSSKPADFSAYRTKHLVEDVRRIAARYTREPLVLVGHDWGGAPAWSFAMAYPEQLSHLVILNSPHPYLYWRDLTTNAAQQEASRYMLLLRDPKAERVLSENNFERLWRFAFGEMSGSAHLSAEDRAAYAAAWAQPGALTGGLNYYRASPLYPPTPDDPGARKATLTPASFHVRVPTLVLWGEKDRALLLNCLDGLAEFVPNLKIVRVPEASHWIAQEQPALVNREIATFIAA
jgi:pimeloyl-ACP methyl ester carboxylesterase